MLIRQLAAQMLISLPMEQEILIECPKCGHQFSADQAISGQLEKKFRQQMESQLAADRKRMEEKEKELVLEKQKLEEFKKHEKEHFFKQVNQKVAEETAKLTEQAQKKAQEKFVAELELLRKENEAKKEENKLLKQKELEILQKERALREQQENLEMEMQKQFLEKARELEDKARKAGREELEMKVREMEMKAEQQNKLIEEMKRKAEQGSMQLQGEVLELALEDLLRASFPFDKISEVGKGVKGADVMQTVRDQFGHECGTIIYESKRTKNFVNDWIDKLKQDLRGQKADIAVIVTETMPRDMEQFGQKDGVWICSFREVKGLAYLLRDSLLRIHQVMASQENKGDKMQMLYDYLTGNEFHQQMAAIVEGFSSLRDGIARERVAMEKLWKEREKQLERVLLNTSGMYGSIRGIAGNAVGTIRQLELPEGEDDELFS